MKITLFVAIPEEGKGPTVIGVSDKHPSLPAYATVVKGLKAKWGANFREAVLEVPDTFLHDCFQPHVIRLTGAK